MTLEQRLKQLLHNHSTEPLAKRPEAGKLAEQLQETIETLETRTRVIGQLGRELLDANADKVRLQSANRVLAHQVDGLDLLLTEARAKAGFSVLPLLVIFGSMEILTILGCWAYWG